MMSSHYFLDWATVWREVNVILAVVSIFCMLKNMVRYHRFWTRDERNIVWGAIGLSTVSVGELVSATIGAQEFNIMIPLLTVLHLLMISGSIGTPDRIVEFKALQALSGGNRASTTLRSRRHYDHDYRRSA